MPKPKSCACTSHCPCQVRKPRKRRNHQVVPHRPNVIQDLLALLIADKYKEPINKPPLVVSTPTLFSSSEKKDVETPTEAIQAPPPSPSPALATFSQGLELLEKRGGGGGGRRGSIASIQESDPGSIRPEGTTKKAKTVAEALQRSKEEAQARRLELGEEGYAAYRKELVANMKKRNKEKREALAMGGLLQTLQEATDKESESANVDFS